MTRTAKRVGEKEDNGELAFAKADGAKGAFPEVRGENDGVSRRMGNKKLPKRPPV